MKITMTSVSVNNPIEAFKFYTEVLGFQQYLYMPEAYLAIVVSPEQPEGTTLLLEPRGNYGSKEYYDGIYNTGLPVIVMGVDDINAEYEKLKEKGVVFKHPPKQEPWGIGTIFDDTCGNWIQLAQR
ncbi:MAG: glyoxalase [Bacteroidetes bacterium 43-93]|nr:VOC family protein [Bacteroidota bacterium]OJW95800.1 MAG: glyoxalase [Bacteroidetes bacterium 43-93]